MGLIRLWDTTETQFTTEPKYGRCYMAGPILDRLWHMVYAHINWFTMTFPTHPVGFWGPERLSNGDCLVVCLPCYHEESNHNIYMQFLACKWIDIALDNHLVPKRHSLWQFTPSNYDEDHVHTDRTKHTCTHTYIHTHIYIYIYHIYIQLLHCLAPSHYLKKYCKCQWKFNQTTIVIVQTTTMKMPSVNWRPFCYGPSVLLVSSVPPLLTWLNRCSLGLDK